MVKTAVQILIYFGANKKGVVYDFDRSKIESFKLKKSFTSRNLLQSGIDMNKIVTTVFRPMYAVDNPNSASVRICKKKVISASDQYSFITGHCMKHLEIS